MPLRVLLFVPGNGLDPSRLGATRCFTGPLGVNARARVLAQPRLVASPLGVNARARVLAQPRLVASPLGAYARARVLAQPRLVASPLGAYARARLLASPLGVDQLVQPAHLALHGLQAVTLQLEGVGVDALPGARQRLTQGV